MTTRYTILGSPLGDVVVSGESDSITGLAFADSPKAAPLSTWQRDDEAFREAADQLRAYFAGELRTFELKLETGGTAFQQRVWAELRTIPYGATTTYARLAEQLDHPRAVRAVGHANGHNPISIIIPCHRVVGTDGKLTGYGGGLDRKQWLLRHERGEKPTW